MENYFKKSAIKIPALEFFIANRFSFEDMAILESLNSGNFDKNCARYSIVGIIAKKKLTEINNETYLYDYKTGENKEVKWIDVIDEFCPLNNQVIDQIQLGAIGYIGYEKKYDFERYIRKIKDENNNIPDLQLVDYSVMYWFDHENNEGSLLWDETVDQETINSIEENLKISDVHYLNEEFLVSEIAEDFDYSAYKEALEKTISYINQGDIFQANITFRFKAYYQGDAFYLYLDLRQTTPNPFFAFFDFKYPLISTSPERFFKVSGDIIEANPIKGTARFESEAEKLKKIEQLHNSVKNIAENAMIVDLMRNDIGRVSQRGQVEVVEFCQVKEFNDLLHLESLIKGKLNEQTKLSQILAALFPPGSVTGAPKIRAVDIIEELEPVHRKAYCGCLGFFGNNGYIDTAVAIRIIYFSESELFFHAGGGITTNSIVDEELEELYAKASKIASSLEKYIVANE